jgi:tetraacyldisaccharide 4'-kinase
MIKLKKPKFWDYQKPNFISNILLPLSKIVQLKSQFEIKDKKKFKEIKSICVGNIYLGGTGKTTLAIELKKILDKENITSCFIKKEYLNQVDEQILLKKFGRTFINKSRSEALKSAISEKYQVAIFDDGLQDKDISYDLSFVCFNQKNKIGNGRVIPAGPLRENLNVLTKYKNIFLNGNNNENNNLKKILLDISPNLNFYESRYKILNLENFNRNNQYIVFSGIGNHETFIEMLKKNEFKIAEDFEYPDHYNYSVNDIKKIQEIAIKNSAKILTTEKDYLRLNMKEQKDIQFVKIYLKIYQIEELKKRLKFINETN